MMYLNVIDPNFDTRLFKGGELERLELLIKSNNERMQHKRSVRIPQQTYSNTPYSTTSTATTGSTIFARPKKSHVRLPKYCPPPVEKFQFLQSMSDVFATNQKPPQRPVMPKSKTNTNMNNYAHKLFVYETYLLNQLNRQRSYQQRYQLNRGVLLKHKYDRQLSNQVSRSLSRKSFSKAIV